MNAGLIGTASVICSIESNRCLKLTTVLSLTLGRAGNIRCAHPYWVFGGVFWNFGFGDVFEESFDDLDGVDALG